MFNKVDILGVKFDNVDQNEAVTYSIKSVMNGEKVFIVTANPEIVMYAAGESGYKKTVNNASLVVADGIGVVIGSKILDRPLKERVAGFDLMSRLLSEASEKGLSVFLLGAKEKTVNKAAVNMKVKHPNLNIVGTHDGYFDVNDKDVMDLVVESNADLVFVAMGYPRQEEWIENYFKHVDHGLAMGVGGSFDVWANEVKRAPKWVQSINLEWLHRLLSDPKRIGRMRVLPQFLVEVMKNKRQEGDK